LRERGVLAVAAAAAFALSVSQASAAAESDWPCVQRLVPELSAGQMWTGTVIEELPADLVLNEDLQALAERLASSGLPPEEAAKAVTEALADVPEDQRPLYRAALFRVTLERINEQRTAIIEGIQTYARRQQALAGKITANGRKLVELRHEAGKAGEVEELTNERAWDMRVFDERQRSLTALCDQPVHLEQRAFALARAMAGANP
jgi:hypothetical protein